MKILVSSYHNPHFITISEYIENAVIKNGHQLMVFDDRRFLIPQRLRSRFPFLQRWDLQRLNLDLMRLAKEYRPDIFLEAGGYRILPQTVKKIKGYGIKTVLWTIDLPRDFAPIIMAAPDYDFVFTGGSEAYELLKDCDVENLHFLPFACDPDIHQPVKLTEAERLLYGNDIVFVGSFYQNRMWILERISDFNLGVWGPGWERIPKDSPLRKCIRKAGNIKPDEWLKIFCGSKIVIVTHYQDSKIPCYQVSPKVYEALASESFLISDAQKDVLTLFRDKEDLAVFNNIGHLRELLEFYLQRPQEREQIARRGRQKVLGNHTYTHRVTSMLQVINNGD